MNSFETDMKRAIISKGFLAGFILELLILWKVGGDSELFRVTVPVISTFPYATAWLADYQSGYIKAYAISALCQERRSVKSVAYFLLGDGVGAAFRDACSNLEQPVYRVWWKLRHLLHTGDPA